MFKADKLMTRLLLPQKQLSTCWQWAASVPAWNEKSLLRPLSTTLQQVPEALRPSWEGHPPNQKQRHDIDTGDVKESGQADLTKVPSLSTLGHIRLSLSALFL